MPPYQGNKDVRGKYKSTETLARILDKTIKRLTETRKNFDNRLDQTIKELEVKVKNTQLDKKLTSENILNDSEIRGILNEIQIYRDYKKIVGEVLKQFSVVLTNAGDIVKSMPNLKEPYKSDLEGFIFYSEPYSIFLENVFNRGEAKIKLKVQQQTGSGDLTDICRYSYPFRFNNTQFEGRLASRPIPKPNVAEARVIASITDPTISPNVLTLRIDRTERVDRRTQQTIYSAKTGEPAAVIMLDLSFYGIEGMTDLDPTHSDYALRKDLSNRLFRNTRRIHVAQRYHMDLINPIRNPDEDDSWTMDRFALFATLIEDRSV